MDKCKSRQVKLYTSRKEQTDLENATKIFPTGSLAILYSPKHCYLAKFENGQFEIAESEKDGIKVKKVSLEQIYEARIFTETAELRWLKDEKDGTAVILSEDENLKFDDKVSDETYTAICLKYLLWGQSTNTTNGNWTQFAEARIGAFFVPIANVADKGYAQFTAVEYLKEFEDGNVAVFEERLTGIKPYEFEERLTGIKPYEKEEK
jgi:CRISPR-associated protein (TIGR03984 family)